MQVLAVDDIAQSILLYLDLTSFDSMVLVMQSTPTLHRYLQDRLLWTKLLFLHFGGYQDPNLQFQPHSTRDYQWDWTSRSQMCIELQGFLKSADEKSHFNESVQVLEGDIEYINDIHGEPIDGILFPTNARLTNCHVGAAAAVFRRAGPALSEYVSYPSYQGWNPAGSTVVTPGFDARVDKLIHCVSPSISMPRCYDLLDATYTNALDAVRRGDFNCVAVVPISTGSLGISCTKAVQVALRAMKKFLHITNWQGKIGVVCYEERIQQAFVDQKAALLKTFNVAAPPPVDEFNSHWLHRVRPAGRLRATEHDHPREL